MRNKYHCRYNTLLNTILQLYNEKIWYKVVYSAIFFGAIINYKKDNYWNFIISNRCCGLKNMDSFEKWTALRLFLKNRSSKITKKQIVIFQLKKLKIRRHVNIFSLRLDNPWFSCMSHHTLLNTLINYWKMIFCNQKITILDRSGIKSLTDLANERHILPDSNEAKIKTLHIIGIPVVYRSYTNCTAHTI